MGRVWELKDVKPNGYTTLRLNGPKLQAYAVSGMEAAAITFVVQVLRFCSLHNRPGGLRGIKNVGRCWVRTLWTLNCVDAQC